jgi:hypothetical protein
LVAVEDEAATFLMPFSLQGQQDVLEGTEVVDVGDARDNDVGGLGLFVLEPGLDDGFSKVSSNSGGAA